jgi:hypothetical protein
MLLRQLLLIGLGVVTWFVAALFIRLALPHGWLSGGPATIAVFLLTLPVAAVSVEGAHRLTFGRAGGLIRTACVISSVGLLLDGIAFVWASGLYTSDRASLALGGAWLLWTVGATLVYALLRPAPTAA